MIEYGSEKIAASEYHIHTRALASEHGVEFKTTKVPLSTKLKYIYPDRQGDGQCTAYSLASLFEMQIGLEKEGIIEADAEKQWVFQDMKSSAHKALEACKEHGMYDSLENIWPLKDYANIMQDIGEYRFWIKQDMAIYCFIPRYDGAWDAAYKTGYLDFSGKESDKIGHRIIFIDYDDEGFIGMNSKGGKWGFYKNGTFKMRYEDFKILPRHSFICFT